MITIIILLVLYSLIFRSPHSITLKYAITMKIYINCYQLFILFTCNVISSLPIRCAVGENDVPRNGKMTWQMTQY